MIARSKRCIAGASALIATDPEQCFIRVQCFSVSVLLLCRMDGNEKEKEKERKCRSAVSLPRHYDRSIDDDLAQTKTEDKGKKQQQLRDITKSTTTNQPTNQPTKKPTNQPTNQPTTEHRTFIHITLQYYSHHRPGVLFDDT